MKKIVSLLSLVAFSAQAEVETDFLDAKYSHLVHPTKTTVGFKGLPKNDVISVIKQQSAVKSQLARGTCSIFSATALIENRLISNFKVSNQIDLSEEWLQYIAVRGKSTDGSSGPTNLAAAVKYGMASEKTLPYIGEDWAENYTYQSEARCRNIKNDKTRQSCLIVHRDPTLLEKADQEVISLYNDQDFINARNEATKFKSTYFKNITGSVYVNSTEEVKALLQKGTPVILEVDFFYGSWNHRKADEYNIGRDSDHFAKGIVTYPETGSMDQKVSLQHPAGHSILVVGYDDNKVIQKTIKMADGTMKTFTYKGVYYFKNSWGTSSFGSQFEVDGNKFPGYGMMTYKYAENYGGFFKLP